MSLQSIFSLFKDNISLFRIQLLEIQLDVFSRVLNIFGSGLSVHIIICRTVTIILRLLIMHTE